MANAKQNDKLAAADQSIANIASAGNALGSAFVRSAEAWLSAQAGLLSSTEVMMADWLNRRPKGSRRRAVRFRKSPSARIRRTLFGFSRIGSPAF